MAIYVNGKKVAGGGGSGGGFAPEIVVAAPAGSAVTATQGGVILSAPESDGVWKFKVTDYGEWVVTATLGEDTASATVNITEVKQYHVELTFFTTTIYGAEWDGSSDPAWSRTDDAADFTDPVPYVAGASEYGSPFDNLMPWAGMTVVEDAEAGTLVQIPKFWYKWTRSGTSMKLQIADGPVEGFFVSPAHADRGDGQGERDVVYVGRYHCGSGYKSTTGVTPITNISRATARSNIAALGEEIWQYDFAMFWTVAMLYLVEFAHWDSQEKIGYGCSAANAKFAVGTSDAMPYHTGTTKENRTTGGEVKYRHIEGLWSNVYDYVDGIYFNAASIYCIKNPADFSDTTGGVCVGERTTSSGYISHWSWPTKPDFTYALYPISLGGPEKSYVCDYTYNNEASSILQVGGYYDQYDLLGLFYIRGYIPLSSAGDAQSGIRLMKLPNKSA